jgi:DNA topoisomerase IB
VRLYIQQHMSDEFAAKDFGTWGGTLLAAVSLAEHGIP